MKSHWSKLFFPIFFVIILFMALVKYISFHTTFWDLGWQDYIVYNIIPGQSWQFLFRGHAHIFSLFYSFLYKFLPSPVLLITCQALAIVGAGLLVSGRWTVDGGQSLDGERWTVDGGQKPNRLQTILIILYLLYFPVWYNCLFDFHFEHLFVLFCAIFYWLVIGQWSVDGGQNNRRQTTDYRLPSKMLVFLICLLCCLVKEVFALSAIMMGVYVIIRRRWLVCGSLIVVFSLLYFIFIECYAVPYFTVGKEAPAIWHNAFGYLGSNMKEVFLNLLTHPWLLITETLSDWRKLLYIIAIFGPFLFIPLLAPLELLPALPQLFISLLSHKDNFYALSSQYTAGLIVSVFVAFIKGLPRAGRLWTVVKDLDSGQSSIVSGQRFGKWSMDGRQKKIDYQPQTIEKKEGVKNGEEQVRESGGMAVGNGVSKRYIPNFKIFPQRGDVWNNFSVKACSNIYSFKYCRGFWQRIRQSFFTISLPSKREFNGTKDIDFNLQGDCNITTREGEKFNKRNRHITPKTELPYNLSPTIDHRLPTTDYRLPTTNYQLLTIILLVSIFFHILLSPSPISRIFWFELVPQYHYTAYIPTKRDAMIKEAIKKYIPDDFNVSVSTQNSVNCAHLAHRRYYFCFPKGVTEPAKVPDFSNKSLIDLWTVIKDLVSGQWTVDKNLDSGQKFGQLSVVSGQWTKEKRLPTTDYRLIYADYVVLDLKRQWFVNDRGCDLWRNGQCHDPAFSQKFLKLVEETKKRYDLVYEKDGFMILRRTISVLDKLNPI